MAINDKSYQPVCQITLKAGEDISPCRFVGFDGKLCAAEAKSTGVSDGKWINGEYMSVVALGVAVVETSEAIAAGDNVSAGAGGKAQKTAGTAAVNGRSLDTVTSAGFIRILLVP